MAMKPVKPTKLKVLAKPKPRPTVSPAKARPTKSRGSKTATQVGNDNQRELYNAYRGQVAPNFKLMDKSDKVSKSQVAKAKSDGAPASRVAKLQSKRNSQRAGGATMSKMVKPAKPKAMPKGKASRGR